MSNSLLDTHKTLKLKIKIKSGLERIDELSRPKARIETDEDTAGPGTFTPNENYSSTKLRSPSVIIGRSERFLRSRIPEMRKSAKRLTELEESSPINYNNSGKANIASHNIRKNGNKLLSLDNIETPGVGKYSPSLAHVNSSFSFKKAKKNFNWKKGIG